MPNPIKKNRKKHLRNMSDKENKPLKEIAQAEMLL